MRRVGEISQLRLGQVASCGCNRHLVERDRIRVTSAASSCARFTGYLVHLNRSPLRCVRVSRVYLVSLVAPDQAVSVGKNRSVVSFARTT